MSYIGNAPGYTTQRVVTTFTATSGQTSFSPSTGYVVGYVDVFLNGVKLVSGVDFTANNGSSVVLSVGASTGDVVETVAYQPRGLTDGYTQAEADARFEPIDSAYTKAESDAKYLTQTQADGLYEPIDSAYTKAEADARFEPIDSAYTKAESDALYLTQAAADGLYEPLDSAYTKAEADSRYLPINATTLPSQTGNAGYYLTTDGSNPSWAPLSVVKVSGVDYPGDDLAADPAGGQTVTVNGSGFASTPTVYVGGTIAPSVTFVSSSQITFTTPAKTAGTYDIYVVNPDGSTAISVFGISYSGLPTWTTAAGSLGEKNGTFSVQLEATSNSAVTYSLSAGSTLPAGITLSSSGLLSGTTEVEQTFNFSVDAIDAENQETPRSFSVTISLADPYFKNTTLLLSGDGTNATQNNIFLDSSANNFTITRNGNTTQGTFSPFSQDDGKWSNHFNGSSYFTLSDGDILNYGSSPFCLEFWAYATSAPTQNYIVSQFTSGNKGLVIGTGTVASGKMGFIYSKTGSDDNLLGDPNAFPLNQWVHVAACRTGNTISLFVNGARVATTSDSGSLYNSTATIGIGTHIQPLGAATWPGYLSNIRSVKGANPYDATQSTLTVPTAPLTAITNTSLLICQSNRFKDSSPGGYALTPVGAPVVQPFSPFAPSAAYSAATNGGSGYFDGSGDYLNTTSNSAFTLGSSGNFTIEYWMYADGAQPTSAIPLGTYGDLNSAYATLWSFIFISGNSLRWYDSNGNTGMQVSFPLSQWVHVAVCRVGSTITMYFNGAPVATQTTNQDYSGTGSLKVGFTSSGGYFKGWISDIRIVKGTAVYTSAFTPPTSPVTAVSGTSFLANFTNAGILDNTGRNVLETVGNAQISTSVKKFGTGSMYFDGSGDYLAKPTDPQTFFGTGDFTVECWVNPSALGSYNMVFGFSSPNQYWSLRNTGYLHFYDGASVFEATTGAISTGQWTHIAISRQGSTLKQFVNGTEVLSSSCGTSIGSAGAASIWFGASASYTTQHWFNGYIDDLRITKGVARYTANFTPPTSAHKLK